MIAIDYQIDRPSDVHVMPDNGRHDCSRACFCEPTLNYVDPITENRVYVHKSEEELNQ